MSGKTTREAAERASAAWVTGRKVPHALKTRVKIFLSEVLPPSTKLKDLDVIACEVFRVLLESWEKFGGDANTMTPTDLERLKKED
jgi:hypothetical protein